MPLFSNKNKVEKKNRVKPYFSPKIREESLMTPLDTEYEAGKPKKKK